MTTVPKRSSASRPTIQQNPIAVQEEYNDDTTVQANSDEEYDDTPITQTPKSVLRHRPIQQPKAKPQTHPSTPTTNAQRNTDQVAPSNGPHWSRGWLGKVILILTCIIGAWTLLGMWGGYYYNQWHYGDGRVSTLDCSSGHYLAWNDGTNVDVVQEIHGDPKNAHIFSDAITPGMFGGNTAQVTLSEQKDTSNIIVSLDNYPVAQLVYDGGTWKWERIQ